MGVKISSTDPVWCCHLEEAGDPKNCYEVFQPTGLLTGWTAGLLTNWSTSWTPRQAQLALLWVVTPRQLVLLRVLT